MNIRKLAGVISVSLAALIGSVTPLPAHAQPADVTAAIEAVASADGVIRQRSAYDVDETIRRIRADIDAKGIRFFDAIDQSALGAAVELPIRRSTLLLFGNPPLGVQFLQSNPYAGLDWPVRMLVTEDADGTVWIAWTDFAFIADRYGITDRAPQFAMASEVAASIAWSAAQ